MSPIDNAYANTSSYPLPTAVNHAVKYIRYIHMMEWTPDSAYIKGEVFSQHSFSSSANKQDPLHTGLIAALTSLSVKCHGWKRISTFHGSGNTVLQRSGPN